MRRLQSNPATPGNKLTLSIDIRLQALVEELFGDRRGALVAIDPRNGEILAFVSKPNFDPNLFVDGIDAENWKALNESIDKPLLNRALRGTYPPGSTYKPFMALAALSLGKRTPQQAISDPGYFWFGNHKFRDDKEFGHGTVDMYKSIVQSCDTYYYTLANDLGVDAIHDFMKPLGLGQLTDIDIHGEVKGVLPSTAWKRAAYRRKEQQKWYAGETISLGIGQGYNAFTMLQLAQATATVASGGQRYSPRLVREVEDFETREQRRLSGRALEPLPLNPEHVAFIHQALYGVTQEGTSARVFAGAPYRSGGKTGTAQVIAIGKDEKYDAKTIDERHRDHALYIAFAPLEEPRVALAMVVENAGFGAAVGGADRAPRVRLPAARQGPERRGHRRHAARPVQRADRHPARRRHDAAAGRGGDAARGGGRRGRRRTRRPPRARRARRPRARRTIAAPMSDVFDKPSLLGARQAGVPRLRRAAERSPSRCSPPAGW